MIEENKKTPKVKKLRLAILKEINKEFNEWIFKHDLNYFLHYDKREESPQKFTTEEVYKKWLRNSFKHEFAKSICQKFYEKWNCAHEITLQKDLFGNIYCIRPDNLKLRKKEIALFFEKPYDINSHQEIPYNFIGITKGYNKEGIGFDIIESSAMGNNKKFWIILIGQFASESREFAALSMLDNINLLSYLLDPCQSSILKNFPNISHEAFRAFSEKLNFHQLSSIRKIMEVEEGINLLEGPPGTGKNTLLYHSSLS